MADCPDAESLKKVHSEAHGDIPHDIVEVNLEEVKSFLGPLATPDQDEPSVISAALRTIMFTDLKGSTDMTTLLGDDEAVRLFEIHDDLIVSQINKCEGRIIKHTGDGFLVAFNDVADAVRSAINIQRKFQEHNSQAGGKSLHVRIGLNAGQPIERGGDLFGMVVNLTARFCDFAQPDQILASGIIYQLLSNQPEIQNVFHEQERTYFKGFPHATQVFEIKWNH